MSAAETSHVACLLRTPAVETVHENPPEQCPLGGIWKGRRSPECNKTPSACLLLASHRRSRLTVSHIADPPPPANCGTLRARYGQRRDWSTGVFGAPAPRRGPWPPCRCRR